MRRQYRRLTATEKEYIADNWEDDPLRIAHLSASLNLTSKQLRCHARYLTLSARERRHSWTDA